MSRFFLTAFGVFLPNLPLGSRRANERKYSLPIYVPLPLVVALRILSGIGWQLALFPAMGGAFFGGQFLEGNILLSRERPAKTPVTASLSGTR